MPEPAGFTFRALGTTAVVLCTDPLLLDAAVEATRLVLADIDLACSRFRPDSDLEAINTHAGHEVTVSQTLVDAIDIALAAARWTHGIVDPTIGESLRVLGYDRDFAAIDATGPSVVHVVRTRGWQVVELDRARHTVRIPAGVRLDLGATAKAFAADRAAAAAFAAAGCGVLVNLGGDLSIAGPPPSDGWAIGIADWHGATIVDDDTDEGGHETIAIGSGALATSSTTVRHWTRGQRDLHHVIDPSTGTSAEVVWRTVSVVAASCVDANVATTAAIVLGRDAVRWLSELGLPARLVALDGSTVCIGGWPIDDVSEHDTSPDRVVAQ